jgi:hypothetical protein
MAKQYDTWSFNFTLRPAASLAFFGQTLKMMHLEHMHHMFMRIQAAGPRAKAEGRSGCSNCLDFKVRKIPR